MLARWVFLSTALVLFVEQGCFKRSPETATTKTRRSVSASTPRSKLPFFRKVYAYSLIPGGVGTSSSFEISRMNDKVLSDHFHDMGSNVVPTKLPQDRLMYSSYRAGDRIYWTKHPILISAGEPLFTDGTTLVRARCGNRLSDSPQRPVQKFSPPGIAAGQFTLQVQMDSPPALIPEAGAPITLAFPDVPPPAPYEFSGGPSLPLESGPDIVPIPPQTTVGEAIPIASTPVIPTELGGGAVSPPVATGVTPEPSTWVMLLVGAACLCAEPLYRRLRTPRSHS